MEPTDLELIDNVKKYNDNVSFITLQARHSPLCFNIYNKYAPSINNSGVCLQDVKEEKDIIIWKSILSFNPEKNVKFSTWLGNQVRYQCLNAINKNGKYIAMEEDQLNIFADSQQPEEDKSENTLKYAFSILEQLKDKRVCEIFKLRYLSDEVKKIPWSKIGEELKISTQTVINLHKKGAEILSQKIKSEELFDQI